MDMRATRLEAAAIALGVLGGVVLLLLRAASEGLLEMGDGVNHYMIARYSWRHPELFLDLWGKPLFTLLASPFAQLGHVGVAAFNALVAIATAWIGVRALRPAGGAAQLAFPFLVLLAPQYVLMVMAGMTEPLFGLLSVITLLLLLQERPLVAAAIASLTPFARPEYIAFVPLVMGWFILQRNWRALPWCLAGFIAYAIIITVVKGDPFWFWTSDPYRHADGVYGSGPLDFFTSRAETVFGRPLLTFGVSALLLWPLIHWKDRDHRRQHRLMLVCAALPVLGIVAVHSVLWYTGMRGSAGLVRVLATAVPLAALFATWTLGRGASLVLHRRWAVVLTAVLFTAGTAVWCIDDLTKQVRLPIALEMNQRFLDAASFGIKEHLREGRRVYSTHPYMAFRSEVDPFDTAQYHPVWGLSEEDVERRFRPGDLLLWDSQLGSNEAGIPLERVLNDGRFAVVEAFEPPEGSRVLGGHIYEIFLFERRDVVRSFTMDTLIWQGKVRGLTGVRMDTVACNEQARPRLCLKDGEFPLEILGLPFPEAESIYDELIVTANARVEEGSRLTIVYSQKVAGKGIRYDQEDVPTGALVFNRRIPPMDPGTEHVLYLWNIGKRPFVLDELSVLRKRWTQRPA
jgi:hypothetical protein